VELLGKANMLATVSFFKAAETLSSTPSVSCIFSCSNKEGAEAIEASTVVAAAVSDTVDIAPASEALATREKLQVPFILMDT
jgi:hypothetical protein